MTKTAKRKLARDTRHCLLVYLVLLEPHVQAEFPDHRERAWAALKDAELGLRRLILAEDEEGS